MSSVFKRNVFDDKDDICKGRKSEFTNDQFVKAVRECFPEYVTDQNLLVDHNWMQIDKKKWNALKRKLKPNKETTIAEKTRKIRT